MAINQTECRNLQKILDENKDKSNLFYNAIVKKNKFKVLMLDSFGNYFIQKLICCIDDVI